MFIFIFGFSEEVQKNNVIFHDFDKIKVSRAPLQVGHLLISLCGGHRKIRLHLIKYFLRNFGLPVRVVEYQQYIDLLVTVQRSTLKVWQVQITI